MKSAKHSGDDSKTGLSARSNAKRWLLSQDEPQLYECSQIEQLSVVLSPKLAMCRNMEVPVSVILISMTAVDEPENQSYQTLAETVKEVAQNLLSVIRAQDLIIQYAESCVAILLVDANQDVGAKVCQRIKEAVHKFSYFHVCASTLQLSFGLSDDSASQYAEFNDLIASAGQYAEFKDLIDSASQALTTACERGDGAIVRASDFDPMKEFRDREHFFPGDKLSSLSD